MKKCCDEPNGSPAAIKAADRAIETQVSYDGNTDSGLEIPSASCCNTGKDSMLDSEVAPCCGPGTQAP
jgi:hypothetical protein